MELIVNKTNLTIKGDIQKNSSTINYYEIPITFDSSWNDLTIKAIMILNGKDKGKEISVINNKIYIDNSIHGIYSIGFVGYKIRGNEKIYQISTDLKSLFFDKGAGEIETENVPLPTPSEWEIYIAQIQSMLSSKQDKLKSGINIKTINKESILGSGNINVEGNQYTAGANIIIKNNVISAIIPDLSEYVTLSSNQTISGTKTFSVLPESSETPSSNNQLSNKKYVDDTANVNVITSSDSTYTIASLVGNTSYKLSEITALTITSVTTFDRESVIYFTSGTTPTDVSLPSTIINLGDVPTMTETSGVNSGTCNSSKNYIIAIENNIAIWKEY